VVFARWKNWPPDVVRRQPIRDLLMLLDAEGGSSDD